MILGYLSSMRFQHLRPKQRLRAVLVGLFIFLAASFARAQNIPLPSVVISETKDADVKLPDFDVTSVKQNKGESSMMRWQYTADGISLMNLSLTNIVASAYNVKQYLISGGPSWINSTSFDVDAKVAPDDVASFKKLSPSQRRLMLQKLLADRFHLAVHFETKPLPVYDLVIAQDGPKFKAAAPDPPPPPDADPANPPKPKGMLRMGPGMVNFQDMPMSAFVAQLGYAVGREVIDKTALTGKYDLELRWTPDNSPATSETEKADAPPNIFTALQEQLGLKLEASKGPVQTLVIDHVEMPSAN